MKLNLVTGLTGVRWVRTGIRTFFRQPLALTGLFFMFMAVVSVLAFVPLVGGVLALVAVPALTLGLMAAARETDEGRFPMPLTLFVALRKTPQVTRAMLMLGVDIGRPAVADALQLFACQRDVEGVVFLPQALREGLAALDLLALGNIVPDEARQHSRAIGLEGADIALDHALLPGREGVRADRLDLQPIEEAHGGPRDKIRAIVGLDGVRNAPGQNGLAHQHLHGDRARGL